MEHDGTMKKIEELWHFEIDFWRRLSEDFSSFDFNVIDVLNYGYIEMS